MGASDVNRSSDGGGGTESRCDSNVGAASGVAETHQSRASKWSRGIKSREDAADSRLRKGREWISEVLSSRVTGDRVARSEVPVGEAGYSALSRSSRLCPSFSLPVERGPSGSMAARAPSVSPSPAPQFSSFSAFLEDNDGDDDLDVEAVDPPTVPVIGDKVQRARVAHCARLGTMEWKDLKHKVP